MGYTYNKLSVEKVSHHLDNIIKIPVGGLISIPSASPLTLSYNIRQGVEVASKLGYTPYDRIKGNVRIKIVGTNVIVQSLESVVTIPEYRSAEMHINKIVGQFIVHKSSYDRLVFDIAQLDSKDMDKLTKVVEGFGFKVTSEKPLTISKEG